MLALLLVSISVIAAQKHVYFMSSKTALISQSNRYLVLNTLSASCQKMGNYCFDPRIGLYKEGAPHESLGTIPFENLPAANSYMFDGEPCKDPYDLFCKKLTSKRAKLELWFSPHSNKKLIPQVSSGCQQKDFALEFRKRCKGRVALSILAPTPKQVSSTDLCQVSSKDFTKTLVKRLLKTTTSTVVLLDDKYAGGELLQVLKSTNGVKIHGIDSIYSWYDSSRITKELSSLCL